MSLLSQHVPQKTNDVIHCQCANLCRTVLLSPNKLNESHAASRNIDKAMLCLFGEFKQVGWVEPPFCIMASWNGNLFRVNGPLWGEIHWSPVDSPHKGQWRGVSMFSLICAWTNGWTNNRCAGDLRRHRAHYDVIVMVAPCQETYMRWCVEDACVPSVWERGSQDGRHGCNSQRPRDPALKMNKQNMITIEI